MHFVIVLILSTQLTHINLCLFFNPKNSNLNLLGTSYDLQQNIDLDIFVKDLVDCAATHYTSTSVACYNRENDNREQRHQQLTFSTKKLITEKCIAKNVYNRESDSREC